MVRIVEFDAAHCAGAKAHPSQAHYQHMLDDPGSFRELWPHTFCAVDGDELIAIGGSVVAEDKLAGWILFTDKIKPKHFLLIHRQALLFFHHSEKTVDLVFAHVDTDNPNAVRWAGLLGLGARRTDFLPGGKRMLRFENHVP